MENITIWDAKLYFKNFSGEPGRFNNAGDRNFGVFIGSELAEELTEDGWNVKYTKSNDEGERRAYLKVKVNFKGNPKIYLVTNGKTVRLDQDTVGELDELFFEKIDLKIRHVYLRNYDVWTQYLDKAYFTVLQDDLDRAYADTSTPTFDEEDEDIPFM